MHNRIPTSQSIGNQPCGLDQRHVERRDDSNNTQRFADRHGYSTRTVGRDRLTAHVPTHTRSGTDHRQPLGELKHRFAKGRSDLVDQAVDQIIFALLHNLGDTQQPAFTLGRGGFLERRERSLGRRHSFANIAAGALGSQTIQAVIKRIKHIKRATTFCVDPLTGNEMLQRSYVCFGIHATAPVVRFCQRQAQHAGAKTLQAQGHVQDK